MRRTLGVVVWALASLGCAQPVALVQWDTFQAGPVGAHSHDGTGIAFWRGPFFQQRLYMTGAYRSGARGRIPFYEYDWSGNVINSANMHTAESQLLTDGKVAGGYAMNVYFGGSIVPGPGSTRNVAIFQRGLNLALGWNRYLDAGADDRLVAMAVDQNDAESVYVLGTSYGNPGPRWFLAKYSAAGVFQFLRLGEFNSIATAVAIDNDGASYATYVVIEDGVVQSRIVKHSSNGTYQWRNGYNPTQEGDVVFTSVATSGERVFAVGAMQDGALIRPLSAAFNPATGARTRGDVRSSVVGSFQKALSAGRGTFYAAGIDAGVSKGLISARYDPDASDAPLWYRKAAPASIDDVQFADATTSGAAELYMTANYGRSDLGGNGIFVAKYNNSGSSQWTYPGFVANESRYASAMTVHPETGVVWLAGRVLSGESSILKAALNQPAVTTNDEFEGPSNMVMTGNVTSNDRYTGLANAILITPPVGGSLDLETNGDFEYTPPNNFVGTKTFTYRVAKFGVSQSNTATVTLTFE